MVQTNSVFDIHIWYEFLLVELTEDEKDHNSNQSKLKILKSICFPGEEDNDDTRSKKAKNPFPYWLTYIAYALIVITVLISALFVMLYGFQFGKRKSDQWVIAMLVSLSLSIIVWQPTKVGSLTRHLSVIKHLLLDL